MGLEFNDFKEKKSKYFGLKLILFFIKRRMKNTQSPFEANEEQKGTFKHSQYLKTAHSQSSLSFFREEEPHKEGSLGFSAKNEVFQSFPFVFLIIFI